VRNITLAPSLRIEDGINAVRVVIPKCWFDASKCQRGLDALRLYRSDYDDQLQVLRPGPVHDWTSHAADAFRYLATALDRRTPHAFYRQIAYAWQQLHAIYRLPMPEAISKPIVKWLTRSMREMLFIVDHRFRTAKPHRSHRHETSGAGAVVPGVLVHPCFVLERIRPHGGGRGGVGPVERKAGNPGADHRAAQAQSAL
jgi:hypothetical protein